MRTTDLIPVGGMLAFLVLERIPALRRHRLSVLRSFFAADLLFLLTGAVLGALFARVYAHASAAVAALGLPRPAAGAPLWATTLVAVVLLDLGIFLVHILLHRSEVLWELHKVHHSSRRLDWLASFRAHLVELVLRNLLAPALLIAAGFPWQPVGLASAIAVVWAMFTHSNLAVAPRFLEGVLVTPRLHRLHHVPATTHRNFGAIFSIWDRLLGRLVRSDAASDAQLGVPGEIESYPQGFVSQSLEPFRRLGARWRRANGHARTPEGS